MTVIDRKSLSPNIFEEEESKGIKGKIFACHGLVSVFDAEQTSKLMANNPTCMQGYFPGLHCREHCFVLAHFAEMKTRVPNLVSTDCNNFTLTPVKTGIKIPQHYSQTGYDSKLYWVVRFNS